VNKEVSERTQALHSTALNSSTRLLMSQDTVTECDQLKYVKFLQSLPH